MIWQTYALIGVCILGIFIWSKIEYENSILRDAHAKRNDEIDELRKTNDRHLEFIREQKQDANEIFDGYKELIKQLKR